MARSKDTSEDCGGNADRWDVWCGVYPREPRMEGLRWLLGLPENVVAHSLVVVGYSDEQVQPEDRFRPERVRQNHW